MTIGDVAAARILWSQAEGVELAEGDEPTQLLGYLQRNPGMSYVAVGGDRLLGALLAGHDGRRGFLYHLAVDPQVRGNGIGRELVERSLEALKTEGITRVLLLVANDNRGGANFWRRLGWDALTFAQPMAIDL